MTQLLIEAREARLDTIWKDIVRRMSAVLEELKHSDE
jgi:hypothetical protein